MTAHIRISDGLSCESLSSLDSPRARCRPYSHSTPSPLFALSQPETPHRRLSPHERPPRETPTRDPHERPPPETYLPFSYLYRIELYILLRVVTLRSLRLRARGRRPSKAPSPRDSRLPYCRRHSSRASRASRSSFGAPVATAPRRYTWSARSRADSPAPAYRNAGELGLEECKCGIWERMECE